MKKILPLLALGLAVSSPSTFAQTSVWKVTKGNATVYLGGTCHMLRPKDLPLPPEFDQAFAAATQVYFETDFARVRSAEMQQVIAERGLFHDGTTLEQAVKPATWEKVRAYAVAAGWPQAQVSRMRPWLFAIMFAATEVQKAGVKEEGVDMIYFNRLKAAGRKPAELERFEDHMNFIANMGNGHEDELIASAFEEIEKLPQVIDRLLTAWKSGDVAAIDRDMNADLRAEFPALYQSLLVERNQNWLPKIEAMFGTPEIELVLAGVGHFAGADGLLAQLQSRGYAVEQVRAAPAAAVK